MVGESNADEKEKEVQIHGDVLEAILSYVPLIHLVPASGVSKTWKTAVYSSLKHARKEKNWLIVHAQGTRYPHSTSKHAYDPRSHVWIKIEKPLIESISTLRSSHSNLLYMLSPRKLSFSLDPLYLTWQEANAPLSWRPDPIVASIGNHVILGGGTCEFTDDPLAVQIYDVVLNKWDNCQPMPQILKDSAATTWLSITVGHRQMFVTEKGSGITYTFNPETRTWSGPHNIRPDPTTYFCAIGFSGETLFLVTLIGDSENVKGAKLYKVNFEDFEVTEICEMPNIYVEKLKCENSGLTSINLLCGDGIVYVHNSSDPREIVFCEFDGDGHGDEEIFQWGSVNNMAMNDGNLGERFVFTCSRVDIEDLKKAFRMENRRFGMRLIG
ncbi:F-box domain [Dillenia turbinata]|uniref:F-box domain n=1 Tax=Dillenia turbinata TaxID=194707 RepID=A0AAN8VJC9_9MAGN